MPNHVKNIVTCPGTDESTIQDICGVLRDFACLIPVPADIQAQDAATKQRPTHLTDVLYNWRLENWGTKWEGYEYEDIEGGLMFETAWSHPLPILRALSQRYPAILFHVAYADEDIGYNLNKYTIQDGQVHVPVSIITGTENARRFACSVWRYDYDAYMAEIAE